MNQITREYLFNLLPKSLNKIDNLNGEYRSRLRYSPEILPAKNLNLSVKIDSTNNNLSIGKLGLEKSSPGSPFEPQTILPNSQIKIFQVNNQQLPQLNVDLETQLVTVNDSSPSISVLWDRAVQQAVINTAVGPTIASRAYAIMHTAMFDAWAAYDPKAIATQLGSDLQRPLIENTEANKTEAMSYAAYRTLKELFPEQAAIFDRVMQQLGLNPNNNTTNTNTAAGIGNVSASALLAFRRNDGSNQLGNYTDTTNYQPINPPGQSIVIDRWTPENVPIDDPNGRIQQFLTPQWAQVTPFALDSPSQFRPVAPKPFLLVDGEVNVQNKTITLANGTIFKIDRSLVGTVINPEFIAQAKEVVDISASLTDEQKLIAEFWEDGSGTSFPPGTWMTFGQFVSARDNNSIDKDAQLFFGLGNAVFDAGIATWEAKVFYDYARPVRVIRDLGKLGLIGEFNANLRGYAFAAWQPDVGTKTILAENFLTYQTPGSDPSPPFAEYTSGHSGFSAAGAEILRQFTGSDFFGASVSFPPGSSRFEPNQTPKQEVTLSWQTFTQAADEAGISRLYGGIHFRDGDLNGRQLGRDVGRAVYQQAQFYIEGGSNLFDPNRDVLFADRRDRLFGGFGDDLLDARNGRGRNLLDGGSGQDQLFGKKRDRLFGGTGDDFLDTSNGKGRNLLDGGAGNDRLFAGSRDTLIGGAGDDTLDASGGRGRNLLNGGAGNDRLFAGSRDTLIGGAGDDEFFVNGGTKNTLIGGSGADLFWLVNSLISTNNAIADFQPGVDLIGISHSGASFNSLSFEQIGANAIVNFQGQKLAILEKIEVNNLNENNFIFI